MQTIILMLLMPFIPLLQDEFYFDKIVFSLSMFFLCGLLCLRLIIRQMVIYLFLINLDALLPRWSKIHLQSSLLMIGVPLFYLNSMTTFRAIFLPTPTRSWIFLQMPYRIFLRHPFLRHLHRLVLDLPRRFQSFNMYHKHLLSN